MRTYHLIAVSLGAIAAVSLSIPLSAQRGPDSGPVARYDMRAGTVSGFGGMGQGGGNIMSSIMGGGGGNNIQHELQLRLGSSNAPGSGRPNALHYMPPGARLGNSVELITPREERGPRDELPQFDRRQPEGRILIYWGCGERAPQGQPVVLDLARIARGEVPANQGLWTSTVPADWGPSLTNSKTFGRWPAEDGKYARPDSSLPGPHRIAGNYSPEISFTLAHDFMAPLGVRSADNRSGSVALSWSGIANATGYYVTLFGVKQDSRGNMGDIVMWSSSSSRQFGGGLTDWLSPATVASLVREGTVLSPQTTSCTVPVEVVNAAPDMRMGTLTAYGPQEDFSYPPRPASANTRWDLQWTARIRHRSTTSWMEAQGMKMGTVDSPGMGMQGMQGQRGQQGNTEECRPRRRGGLGGALGGALGGVLGGGGGDGC